MIQKIKQFLVIGLASSTLFATALVPAVASAAASNNIYDNVCKGANNAASGTDDGCGNAGLNNDNGDLKSIASKVVTLFSIIVGIIAVIMIIWGGLRYITSGGDSGKVGNAKSSLIYAIIGLIIVALAQFIVHFVLNTANSAVTTQ